MAADINMYLVDKRDNSIILSTKDLFEGRNYEWFENMQQRGSNVAYDYMPVEWDYEDSDKLPEDCCYNADWTYGHRAIRVDELLKWFTFYKPAEDGVYLTERENWLYESKGIFLEAWERHYPDAEEGATIFTVVRKKYEPILHIIDVLCKKIGTQPPEDYYLLWCFDN